MSCESFGRHHFQTTMWPTFRQQVAVLVRLSVQLTCVCSVCAQLASSQTSAVISDEGPIGTEYCQWETFNASCPSSDQVVLIQSARYGRMRFGRCVREDHGNVGCSADVRPYVDRKCSGRRRCQLPIPDAALHAVHPCPKELMPYLEASYSCVTVKSGSRPTCSLYGGIPLSPSTGFLSSVTAVESGVGTSSCPWLIDVPAGRRVNVTLFAFFDDDPDCFEQNVWSVVVREARFNVTADVPGCRAGQARERIIYTSRGNSLQVYLDRPEESVDSGFTRTSTTVNQLLLRYQVFGCADLKMVPSASSVRRVANVTYIKCNGNNENIYSMSCVADRWVSANFSGCTKAAASVLSDQRQRSPASNESFSYGLLVVIGTGVLTGLALGLLLLLGILLCFRRQHRRAKMSSRETTDRLLTRLSEYDQRWQLQTSPVDFDVRVTTETSPLPPLLPSAAGGDFFRSGGPDSSSPQLCAYHRHLMRRDCSRAASLTMPRQPAEVRRGGNDVPPFVVDAHARDNFRRFPTFQDFGGLLERDPIASLPSLLMMSSSGRGSAVETTSTAAEQLRTVTTSTFGKPVVRQQVTQLRTNCSGPRS